MTLFTSRLTTPALLLLAVGAAAAPAPALADDDTRWVPRLTLDASALPSATGPATDPAPRRAAPNPAALTHLSLEDLMNIEVTSVSKRAQRVSEAPAAITVITQEEIRRSGMSSIPELLRLAPGLHVAQVSANQWAVGSRAHNNLHSNNLLVLMDGRTLYTPLFSGTYWDRVDYILADLDRIEVIRGPGATLWGANAVNGVINITTKDAQDTQGLYLHSYLGTDGCIESVRYGGSIGANTHYRVYGKYRSMDDFELPGGSDSFDGYDMPMGGFRVDSRLSPNDHLTVQGDAYTHRAGHIRRVSTLTPPYGFEIREITNSSGGNVLTRWTHTFSEDSAFTLQIYYDRLDTAELGSVYTQNTFDVEFQHRFRPVDAHEIIWGLGYRLVSDFAGSANGPFDTVAFTENYRDSHLYSAFVQDDITLIPNHLHLILGTKIEHNDYSGLEIQPSGRIQFTPDERNTLWASISRAVRTPSRWEETGLLRYITMPGVPLPTSLDFVPNPQLQAEELIAFEAGYRVELSTKLTLDLAGFINIHDNYRNFPTGMPAFVPTPVPHVSLPTFPGNQREGLTYGGEIALRYHPSERWQIGAAYSYISGHFDQETAGFLYSAPTHQVQLSSHYEITRDLEFNVAAFYAGSVDQFDVPGYVRVDANLAWRPRDNMEVMVGVRNLFDNLHPEYRDDTSRISTTEVPRTFFVQMSLRF